MRHGNLLHRLAVWIGFVVAGCSGHHGSTPLDAYVHAPDASYRWEYVSRAARDGYTLHVIDMVSQTWRDVGEVDRRKWRHWLVIVEPDGVTSNVAFMDVGHGSNRDPAPGEANPLLVEMAVKSRTIAAEVYMIPNQPLSFPGEEGDAPHGEDALIAHTWMKFLEGGDARWPLRNPMVKSVVRAMDTVTAAMSQRGHKVDRFTVCGPSKRGWTTWLTAAVDPRVAAAVPLVIDILNVEPSMKHHRAAYGGYAPVMRDYINHGVPDWHGTPRHRELLDLVDPYVYRHRYTMPKFIVNAGVDEFFAPDSSRFYYDDLPGPKRLRYASNSRHGHVRQDAWPSIIAFHHAIAHGRTVPDIHWTFDGEGAVRVRTSQRPITATLWQAVNEEARNFRFDVVGYPYEATPVMITDDNAYTVRVERPERGWKAYTAEFTFDSGVPGCPFVFTTPIRIIPDTLP